MFSVEDELAYFHLENQQNMLFDFGCPSLRIWLYSTVREKYSLFVKLFPSHALGVPGAVDRKCGADPGGKRSILYAAEDP